MKTFAVPEQASEINALLTQAREEDLLVRSADGTEFVLAVVDDFDREVAATRRNAKLMAFLEECAKETETLTHEQVLKEFGLSQ